MPGDDPTLIALAAAVLDGEAADWNAFVTEASESTRAIVAELRAIAAIGSVKRSFVAGFRTWQIAPPPVRWGHLTIVDILGRGAFGSVHRAWDTKLEREVALKLLGPYDPSTADAVAEGRLLARVHHPNVVTIFGADRVEGRTGLWMEIVQGETLEAIVARDGPLPIGRVVEIGRQLCSALAAVHAAGLVHRDIKTQNVMLTEGGRVVLMDFGAGGRADAESNGIAGTPLYLAPEIFEHEPASPQSDIYAAGVVVYRLLTGAFPVHGRSMVEVRAAHQKGSTVTDVRSLRRSIPRSLARVVSKALCPDPAARFSSADDMSRALTARVVTRAQLAAAAAVLVPIVGTGAFLAVRAVGAPASRGNASVSSAGFVPETPRSRRLVVPDDALFFTSGLSADGRYFTYTANDGSVRQHDVANEQVRTIVNAQGKQEAEFVISSPDGSQAAYQWWTERNTCEIRVVDTRSGQVRVLLRDDAIDEPQPVQWSADGKQVLVLERVKAGVRRIALLDVADGRFHQVLEMASGTPLGLSISPDGRFVAYDSPPEPTSRFRSVRIVDANGQNDRELMPPGSYSDWSPQWTPDGSGIFFLSDRTGAPDGWFVPVSGGASLGEAQVLVRNLSRVIPLGLTARGEFYYRLQTGAYDVFEAQPDSDASSPRRLSGRFRGSNIGVSYSQDGTNVAYIVVRDGYGSERDRSVMIRNLQSGEEHELRPLPDLGLARPRWSQGDRFLLVRGRTPQVGAVIAAVDASTGQLLHIVTPVPDKDETDFGPIGWDTTIDGAVYENARRGLVRHSITTGVESVLYPYAPGQSHGRIHRFGISAVGGTRLAFSAFLDDGPRELDIVERGIERTLVTVESPRVLVFQGWSGDGAWVYYTVVGASDTSDEVWRVHASGGAPERFPLTIPRGTQINGMSVNPVTGAVAYTAGTPTTELWLIEGFLPRTH